MRLTEFAGGTLGGAIDGQNRLFSTSTAMVLDDVGVYLNGRLKLAALDDGYTLPDPYTVLMREAPLPGDTLQVDYALRGGTGGQAGGIPPAPVVRGIRPPNLEVRGQQGPVAVVVRGVAPPLLQVRPVR